MKTYLTTAHLLQYVLHWLCTRLTTLLLHVVLHSFQLAHRGTC